MKIYTVNRQTNSKNWAVYCDGQLIEGGFFSREAAEECADNCAYDAVSGQSQHLTDREITGGE